MTHLLVAFTETLWRRDLVALGTAGDEIWMLRVEQCEEAVQQQVVADRSCSIVCPDTSALHHVALFDRFSSGGRLVGLLSRSLRELGFELIGIGLGYHKYLPTTVNLAWQSYLRGLLLLLFLQRRWVEFAISCCTFLFALLCLGLLLFLLRKVLEHIRDLVNFLVAFCIACQPFCSVIRCPTRLGGLGLPVACDSALALRPFNSLDSVTWPSLSTMVVPSLKATDLRGFRSTGGSAC